MNTELILIIINSTVLFIYFFMLRTNNKMVVETKEMVRETKLTREQAYRPEIIAFFREENELLFFCIQNTGTRTAYDIHIEINDFFLGTRLGGNSKEHEKFFYQTPKTIRDVEKIISLLAPNQKIESFAGIREIILEKNLKYGYSERNVKITYRDVEGKLYIEEYILCLEDFSKRPFFKKDNLEEIAIELRKLRKEISKITNPNEESY